MMANEQATNPYTGEAGMPHGYVSNNGFGHYVPPGQQPAYLWTDGTFRIEPEPAASVAQAVDMIALRKWAYELAQCLLQRYNDGVEVLAEAERITQYALTGKRPD